MRNLNCSSLLAGGILRVASTEVFEQRVYSMVSVGGNG